ncbi:MAG: redoxin domain-containing protein [Blastocatellales bacterium]|nr:redoxin domain-containing protein [Blastocatellales bacterium]
MAIRIGTQMPSFEGATEWINRDREAALAETKGQPTLVHFWSLSCGLCKENLPRVAAWRDEKRDLGLRVIAVHMPRYPQDVNPEGVRESIANYNISEACAVDDEHKLRDAFGNDQGWVPAYYFFDAEGKLRGFAAGEKGLNIIAPTIDRVLGAFAADKTHAATI